MRRHGVGLAAGDASDAAVVHFGFALWPYDLLLRFGYDLPEHDHRWAGQWFDDRFEAAAIDVRSTASKLFLALADMDDAVRLVQGVGAGTPFATLRSVAESAPLKIDLVASYLRRLVDDLIVVTPHCYGEEGRIGDVADVDDRVARLLVPPDPLARVLSAAFSTHTAELYAVAAGAGDAPALPRAASAALRESAQQTLAAAAAVDAALAVACPWLDALLDHLIGVVCTRAEDGPDLRKRWAESDWSELRTSARTRALMAHLPTYPCEVSARNA